MIVRQLTESFFPPLAVSFLIFPRWRPCWRTRSLRWHIPFAAPLFCQCRSCRPCPRPYPCPRPPCPRPPRPYRHGSSSYSGSHYNLPRVLPKLAPSTHPRRAVDRRRCRPHKVYVGSRASGLLLSALLGHTALRVDKLGGEGLRREPVWIEHLGREIGADLVQVDKFDEFSINMRVTKGLATEEMCVEVRAGSTKSVEVGNLGLGWKQLG